MSHRVDIDPKCEQFFFFHLILNLRLNWICLSNSFISCSESLVAAHLITFLLYSYRVIMNVLLVISQVLNSSSSMKTSTTTSRVQKTTSSQRLHQIKSSTTSTAASPESKAMALQHDINDLQNSMSELRALGRTQTNSNCSTPSLSQFPLR